MVRYPEFLTHLKYGGRLLHVKRNISKYHTLCYYRQHKLILYYCLTSTFLRVYITFMFYYENKLREIRKAKGLTQGEVAEKAGINRAFLSKVENHIHGANREWYQRAASALGVPIEQIIHVGKGDIRREVRVNSTTSGINGELTKIVNCLPSLCQEDYLTSSIKALSKLNDQDLESVWEFLDYLVTGSNLPEYEKEYLRANHIHCSREELLMETASDLTSLREGELYLLYSHIHFLIFKGERKKQTIRLPDISPDTPF
jgi:transcriptional regulator with XRE-family HTH domain